VAAPGPLRPGAARPPSAAGLQQRFEPAGVIEAPGEVTAVGVSPDGAMVAAGVDVRKEHGGLAYSEVWLWRAADGGRIRRLGRHDGPIGRVAFSPDGKLLGSGSLKAIPSHEACKIWRVADGRLARSCGGTLNGLFDWSPDGATVVVADWRLLKVFRIRDGKLIRRIPGPDRSAIPAVAFSADGRMVASASSDNDVRLWRVRDGAPAGVLTGHSDGVNSVAFSPRGDFLASGSADGTARIWRLRDHATVRTLPAGGARVVSVAYSPDGRMLAGAAGERIVLWRTEDGSVMQTIDDPGRSFGSLLFGQGGRMIGAAGGDARIRLWRVRAH
jgi:dipeptidyl aminopeptidase/acylaminoacyl peptidase